MKKITLAVALLAAALGAAAQDKACPPADEKKAEAAIDRVVNWDLLYKSWQEYKQCDKGSVGEGFTEALMRLIVDWKQVDVLAKQVEANREYRDFVHRHIDSPAALDAALTVLRGTVRNKLSAQEAVRFVKVVLEPHDYRRPILRRTVHRPPAGRGGRLLAYLATVKNLERAATMPQFRRPD